MQCSGVLKTPSSQQNLYVYKDLNTQIQWLNDPIIRKVVV